jgi:hypothetical protein
METKLQEIKTLKDIEPESLKVVLTKLCSYIKKDTSNLDFSAPYWYKTNSWTTTQEQDFTDWLSNHLYSNKKARKEMYLVLPKRKKLCKSAAQKFTSSFGWKTKF